MEARSIAEVPEAELVQVLSGDPMLRRWLFAPFLTGTGDRIFLQVPFGSLSPRAGPGGDVDALLLPAGEVGRAVAYQIKRVKVSANTFHTLKPGKLGDLPKAIHQANTTLALGFSRVVLSVLVVTDGRSRVEFNFTGRGPTGEIIGEVGRALDLTPLHPDIGVAWIEIVQPVDRDVTFAGGIGGALLRAPTLRDQAAALTTALAAFVSSHAGA